MSNEEDESEPCSQGSDDANERTLAAGVRPGIGVWVVVNVDDCHVEAFETRLRRLLIRVGFTLDDCKASFLMI